MVSQNHSIFQNSKANIHDEEGSGWPKVCEIETNSNFSSHAVLQL